MIYIIYIVTYHFAKLDDSFNFSDVTYVIDGKKYCEVSGKLAVEVRDAKYQNIDVYLK